jgi:hypothetical protein
LDFKVVDFTKDFSWITDDITIVYVYLTQVLFKSAPTLVTKLEELIKKGKTIVWYPKDKYTVVTDPVIIMQFQDGKPHR